MLVIGAGLAIRNMERVRIPRNIALEISRRRTEAGYRCYDIACQQDLNLAATKMGWVEGFEPSATGTTIQRSTS
jgi:hypothetical protein